jgi:hypothetical protein
MEGVDERDRNMVRLDRSVTCRHQIVDVTSSVGRGFDTLFCASSRYGRIGVAGVVLLAFLQIAMIHADEQR